MALIKDNSYLIDFDNEDVIGYIFKDKDATIYTEKYYVTIMKDESCGKIYRNISKGKICLMNFQPRGFENFYSKDYPGDFKEINTIQIVKKSEINISNEFDWISLTLNMAIEIANATKLKDTKCKFSSLPSIAVV